MKQIFGSIFFSLLLNLVFGQNKSAVIRSIDAQVSMIELNKKYISDLFVDSSRSTKPYTESFFVDTKTGMPAKVEFVNINPYLKIIYYFLNDNLIKVISNDKLTSAIGNIQFYFKTGKLIFTTHRNIDGDNGEEYLIKQAHDYLLHFGKGGD